MDERAEIWIARDPETNAESKPVSLRKLRKGVRIGRLSTTMLVTRAGSTEWVTLERLIQDAENATPLGPPVVMADASPLPAPAKLPDITSEEEKVVLKPSEPPPPKAPDPSRLTPTVPPAPRAKADITDYDGGGAPKPPREAQSAALRSAAFDHDAILTAQWFAEPAPEPDDDEPIFVSQSLLDLNFERVMTTKLVKLTYVLLIAALAMAVLASFVRVAATLATGNSQQIATAIVMVPLVVLVCAVVGAFGRMMLEVLLAIFRISDRMSRIAR